MKERGNHSGKICKGGHKEEKRRKKEEETTTANYNGLSSWAAIIKHIG